jgi:MFS family permease
MAEERQREPSYAWVVVGVMFFAQAVALGVRGTIGLLVNPWEAEFGWDRAAVSLTASLGFVVYGLAQAFSGRWADRTGSRVIFATSIAILGVGTMAVSSIVTLWQAYAIFGVLIMLGIGGASSPTSAVAVARWFTARRGLALGIVGAGSAAGQFVLVPVMATLVGSLGWRAAFLWLGVGSSPWPSPSSCSCYATIRARAPGEPARRRATLDHRCPWPRSCITPTSGGSPSPSSYAA